VSRIVQGFILPTIFLFGPAGFLLALAISGGSISLSSTTLTKFIKKI
jgi:hypothetical protein